MCKIDRICFVPAFSPYIISQGKQSTDSLLLSKKYLLKSQGKHFISEKRSTKNRILTLKFHPLA